MDSKTLTDIIIVILVVAVGLYVLNSVTLWQFIVVIGLLAVVFYALGWHFTITK